MRAEIEKVFMIVSDPVGAGVVRSLEQTDRRDPTGTDNRVPAGMSIETLRACRTGFERLGLQAHADLVAAGPPVLSPYASTVRDVQALPSVAA